MRSAIIKGHQRNRMNRYTQRHRKHWSYSFSLFRINYHGSLVAIRCSEHHLSHMLQIVKRKSDGTRINYSKTLGDAALLFASDNPNLTQQRCMNGCWIWAPVCKSCLADSQKPTVAPLQLYQTHSTSLQNSFLKFEMVRAPD